MLTLPPAIPAELSQLSTTDETGDENEVTFEVSTMPTMLSPLPAILPEPNTTTCEFVEPQVRPVKVDAYEGSQDSGPPLMATLSDPSATRHPSPFRKDMSGLSVTTVQ
jgi:hypothetical protein